MAVAVPVEDAGLGMAGLARGAGAYEGLARPAEMGEQFPPLPAVPSAVPDQAGPPVPGVLAGPGGITFVPERGDLSQQGNQAALRPPVGTLPARRRCGASQIGTHNRRLGAGDPPVLEQPWSRTEYLFGRRTRSLGRLSKLSH
jgi:hypothetical protein